jgi:hypothetical protein
MMIWESTVSIISLQRIELCFLALSLRIVVAIINANRGSKIAGLI